MPQPASSTDSNSFQSLSPLIDIHNIDLYRGGSLILQNFFLTIPLGCRYAILGPNGSGKTSLIMLLTRTLYPAYKQESWIKILGHSRWRVSELQSRMGIISYELQKDYPETVTGLEVVLSGFYQSRGIYPHQQVSDEKITKAEAILDYLDIARLQEKKFAQMSAGEQRRCLLARAWINNPDCFILDEPTHGMDLKSTWQYLGYLRKWVSHGKSVVLVTHHLNEIIPEIDTVILMKEGKVFSQGPKKETLTVEKLSALYDMPLRIFVREGYYFVISP